MTKNKTNNSHPSPSDVMDRLSGYILLETQSDSQNHVIATLKDMGQKINKDDEIPEEVKTRFLEIHKDIVEIYEYLQDTRDEIKGIAYTVETLVYFEDRKDEIKIAYEKVEKLTIEMIETILNEGERWLSMKKKDLKEKRDLIIGDKGLPESSKRIMDFLVMFIIQELKRHLGEFSSLLEEIRRIKTETRSSS